VDLPQWPELYARYAGWTPDPAALRWWEVLGSVKMSCLVWRAATAVPADAERALLVRLFDDLGAQVQRLTGQDR
jgi:hypothetical protein